jgi:hypothetical protein
MKTLMLTVLLLGFAATAQAAPHWEADLVWLQPAPLPTSITVERKMGATGTYATLATPVATALSFTDVGPYTDGQVVCWRVVAKSTAGVTVGDETCAGAPVQMPGKPGAPTINWRFVPTP